MSEQTEVERLTKEKAKIDADLAAATELERQQKNLLPKLEKREEWLMLKMMPFGEEVEAVRRAISDINENIPTTYRLRRPRAPKPAEGAE